MREHNISEQTFYNWKRKYQGMEVEDVRTMRATALSGTAVAACLGQWARERGLPQSITVDNGPEF